MKLFILGQSNVEFYNAEKPCSKCAGRRGLVPEVRSYRILRICDRKVYQCHKCIWLEPSGSPPMPSYGKRGRGASGKMPFVAALSLSDKGHPLFLKLSHLSGFTLEEIATWATAYIRPGSSVISDGLNCFPGVTQAQCEHDPVITTKGGKYIGKVFEWLIL